MALTISGTVANQTTTSEAPISPFAGVTIGDANAGATDTLTIELFGRGTLRDGTGFGGLTRIGAIVGESGFSGATSVYSLLNGSPQAITSELDALVFIPVNTSVTTRFTLIDDSSREPKRLTPRPR
jgi:hypothetical protein